MLSEADDSKLPLHVSEARCWGEVNSPTTLLMCQRVQQTQEKEGWHTMRKHKMTSLKGTLRCLHVAGYV